MRWFRTILLVVLVAIVTFSGYHLFQEVAEQKEQRAQEELFRQLAESVSEHEPGLEPEQDGEPVSELESPYAALYGQNEDMVGWISIDGTKVDYPVMQTKESPNYYLRRNFYGEYSVCGCIYAQEDCDVEDGGNVILYGHHMKNGTMFGSLSAYKKKSFFEDNRYIRFDTPSQSRQYEIMAVFQTTADDAGFPYTAYANLDTEERFDEYVSKCRELALYETGVDASYGDQLLTLSTCDYYANNGRLVVVAVCRS